MLELGEGEGGADYFGGSSGAGGDALEGGSALAEQAGPRSLWLRRPRSSLLRVFASGSSRWLPGLGGNDRITVARIAGVSNRRAGQLLTGRCTEPRAVAGLAAVAGGRADLLAQHAGIRGRCGTGRAAHASRNGTIASAAVCTGWRRP
jgi:hypothetical protein